MTWRLRQTEAADILEDWHLHAHLISGSIILEQVALTPPKKIPVQMGDFSEAFKFDRMRSGNPAVYLLKEQFEKFVGSPQELDVFESIALCFYQLEQYEDAASWYETAGRLILSEPSTPAALKAMAALGEYERALECYRCDDDDGKFSECSTLIGELRRASASA
jgi:tetratricopeptide (TPR) repeat protein